MKEGSLLEPFFVRELLGETKWNAGFQSIVTWLRPTSAGQSDWSRCRLGPVPWTHRQMGKADLDLP